MKKEKLNTQTLIGHIKSSLNIDEALIYSDNSRAPTFSCCFNEMMQQHDCTISQIIIRANISKAFAYQILNGNRIPGRDLLLRIAFAMNLTLEETQYMLTIARRGPLYPQLRRDAAIIFGIEKGYTAEQTSEMLENLEETPLL